MIYRPEIDGLRALAILPVILFHAGFGQFSGGYVGVDVFFVISGYLITTILLNETRSGSFSLTRFYERRARRIMPALFVVLLACIPFAWALLIPRDLEDFAQSIASTIVFSSNILFWKESGYFESANELKPLLHTWSLAVEEQYYIFFPLLLVLLKGWNSKSILWTFSLISIASLVAAELYIDIDRSAAFYLIPFRAWELLAGSICALIIKDQLIPAPIHTDSKTANSMSLTGLALITLPIFIYDNSTDFPGINAIPPVLGTCLVVIFANKGTWAHELLTNRVAIWIGLLSYSAYLWHQPIFAFTRYVAGNHPPQWLMALLCVFTFMLAYGSWRYVETPFRDAKRFSRTAIFSLSAAGCAAFLSVGVTGYLNKGFMERYTGTEKEIFSYLQYKREPLYKEGLCFLTRKQKHSDIAEECIDERADLMVWGDSHAAALSSGFRSRAGSITQITASACPPIVDIEVDRSPNCKDINNKAKEVLASTKPPILVLHAIWSSYPEKIHAFKNTIDFVKTASPSTRIVVVGGVPLWDPDLPSVMVKNKFDLNGLAKTEIALPNPSISKVASSDKVIRQAVAQYATFSVFYSPTSELCDQSTCLAVAQASDGKCMPYAWDYGHLTLGGAIDLTTRLDKFLKSETELQR